MSPDAQWQFWIDVGGTFTDCLARRPDGSIQVHKLLSSGVYRGRVGPGSTSGQVTSSEGATDPDGFFVGWKLLLLNEAGQPIGLPSEIAEFNAKTGCLRLAIPLAAPPRIGQGYELSCGLEAPIVGIRWLMGKGLREPIGPAAVRLGTTRGTNALLERQGAATAFVTTRGFRDVLRIGQQNRPKLFDLHIRKPSDLYREVVEIDERMDAEGSVLVPLDEEKVRRQLAPLREKRIESLAVCLLHSYRNGVHEEQVAKIAGELGFEQVSVSSRLAPLQRIVPRGDTTVVDAYLTPIIRAYVQSIRAELPEASLKLMTSSGSLVDAGRFVGKDSVLSGPAGGVVGVAQISRAAGFRKAVGFDMGGTSTDVSRFAGEFERRYMMEVNDPASDAGVRIVAPMLSIETVAAGGGSICRFDGQKAVVGPESAGSNPGPACYGRGGPLTITDCNVHLGRVLPGRFAFPLDTQAVARRLDELCGQIQTQAGQSWTPDDLAIGFVRIANANMAAAIKKVSIARGYDVRDDVLVSFGGAGAQHACAIARELGIRKVLQHPYAGVLSAYGIGMADVTRFADRHVGELYSPETLSRWEPILAALEDDLLEEVRREGIPLSRIRAARRILELRYKGQDSTIPVPRPASSDYAAEFETLHRRLYGFAFPGRTIEILTARVERTGETERPTASAEPVDVRDAAAHEWTNTFFEAGWIKTAVYSREQLRPGDRFHGPAIVVEPISTIILEPGWQGEMTSLGDIVLTDLADASERTRVQASSEPDAVSLELFNNRFASIAEQMGATLQKTSTSTNVKERLDFSCAIFTATGDLVVNAPHIPVHLGAMGETVRRLVADEKEIRAGDVFITNDPYAGGSHLPDVTVLTPVFDEPGSTLLFFTGSRAHHAEIGGIVPGSMPPFSKTLAEEGVLIRRFRLVAKNEASETELRRLLSSGQYPSRAVDENIADVHAQTAANQTGSQLLSELVAGFGQETVLAYMGHIRAAAERKLRLALLKIPAGEHRFEDYLDSGAKIAVCITIHHNDRGGEATVDFTGTDPVTPDNLNANPAIVRSAVLYSFRCLIDEEIPLNDGVLAPVTIHVPKGCLLHPPADPDPTKCPAVGGGNVETSQRVVDVLLGALGLAAASQGTMNNFLFGRTPTPDRPGFGYYETIGGGAGAGPTFPGASAVHTHMTNTRITDAEVFEDRYPIRLVEFSIRRGTGGAGKHSGGDGMIREVEFLEPLDVSLLTNRRKYSPYGLAGGQPGTPGVNLLFRAGSEHPETLPSSIQLRVQPHDRLRIETPSGGGYGVKE